jgi:stearoyl-CoA desaturase (delta-9 desaturase)
VTEPPSANETTNLPVANPGAELPHADEEPGRISLAVRVAALFAIIVPHLGLLLGLYVLTGLGITVGYHRLFVHRSFETNTVVKFVFAVLGSMAVEGPLLKWVAMHRAHHQHADKLGDPHSPQGRGRGVLGVLGGFWHAHVGWLFDPDPPDLGHYVEDLRRSHALRVASAMFPVWAMLGLLIPAVLGGLITRTWTGVWTGLIWGEPRRCY